MFGTSLFGTFLFGGSSLTSLSSVSPFEYNGYAFGTDNFRLNNIPDFQSADSIFFDAYDIALGHGGGLNGYKMKPKRLLVKGILIGSSASELEVLIDAMKYALLQEEETLTYTKPNGVIINTIASCTSLRILREHYHITFVPVEIEFTILDPFFYGVDANEVIDSGNTTDFSGTLSVLTGNYEAYPIFYITYNSASSCTSLSVTLNGQTITIESSFTTGDIIIIDSKIREVTINSIPGQDYTGEFPSLPLGYTPYSVDSDGTFNIDLLVQRYDTYV